MITFQLHLTYEAYAVTVKNPIPPSEKLLFTFKNGKDLARWTTFTDQEFGGQSEAKLALSEKTPVRAGTAFGSVLFIQQTNMFHLAFVNSRVHSNLIHAVCLTGVCICIAAFTECLVNVKASLTPRFMCAAFMHTDSCSLMIYHKRSECTNKLTAACRRQHASLAATPPRLPTAKQPG